MTPSGFAAESVVAVTQHTALPDLDPVRVLLQELMHLRTQIRRHICELQLAVRELDARGGTPDRLAETVDLSIQTITRIDDAMQGIGRRLRTGRTAFPNQ